jgi:ribosomal protein L28
MSNSKSPKHISKPLTKKTYLPNLQKRIFLYIANNDPKTINETAKATKGDYKSSWNAFKKLEKKNLVKIIGSKNYQGQEYPRYWVSEDGAFIALCEGANAKSVIKRTLEIYPKRRDLQYLLEAVSILGIEAFDVAYFAYIKKGKLEQSDIAIIMATQMQHKLTPEGLKKYSELLQRYPEQSQRFIDFFKEISDNVKKLDALFKQSTDKKKEPNN